MSENSIAFDRAAEIYDGTRGFPPGIENQATELIAKVGHFTPTTRVLEIGIGTGRIALPLAPHVQTIYGIDLAVPMMKKLQAKQTSEKIYLTHGNAEHLPYPDQTFDAAVAVHVFHLIPGWKNVLKELARVLKPEGKLIHAWGDEVTDTLWSRWNKEYAYQFRTPTSYFKNEQFMLEAGWLKTGERQTFQYPVNYALREFMTRIEQRQFSATWQMTDAQIADGVAYMEKLVQETYGDPDQSIEYEQRFTAEAYRPPYNRLKGA